MIDFQMIKLLMAGRAGVYGLLADSFSEPMDTSDVYNLCKYLYDLTESVEVIDAEEEILKGFKGLALWHKKTEQVDKEWAEGKLKEEFHTIFDRSGGLISIIFPNTEDIDKVYESKGYKAEHNPAGLNEMLSFMSFLSVETAKQENIENVADYAKFQLEFLNRYIIPVISAFCEALYEAAPNYGIYQYISEILHGYLMLDIPTLKYFDQSNPLS